MDDTAAAVEAERTLLKRKRTTAKSKFTRTLNILKENVNAAAPRAVLNKLHDELNKAYDALEERHDAYLAALDDDTSHEAEAANTAMETAYRERFEIYTQMMENNLEKEDDNMSNKSDTAPQTTVRVKKLEAPKFSGAMRKFPTFIKDYRNYMEPTYGEDSYALRSCLSGQALEVVSGVDDNYREMWVRLKLKYGNPERLVDSIMNDIKLIDPIKENDSAGLLSMINTVEHCWLDLKKVNLEQEMDTSMTISMIEKLLPRTQKREWTLYKQQQFEKYDGETRKFGLLLEFLLNEKHAIEYMYEDIRDKPTENRSASVNLTDGSNEVKDNVSESDKTLKELKHAVEELTKMISASAIPRKGRVFNNSDTAKCWLHNSNTHNVIECNQFVKLPNQEKISIIKKHGVCYQCLKGRHLSRDCPSAKKCEITDEHQQPCNKSHHPLLHEAHIEGISFHNKYNCNPNTYEQTLLMVSTINCKEVDLNAILDPCSNLSLITHNAARKLNLRGRIVTVTLTKVGNVTETNDTREYELPLKDKNGKSWNIKVYGINEITSDIGKVDISNAIQLFERFKVQCTRPYGKVDVLLGLDCCELLPNKVAEIHNLQLMDGPLGYCLRGSHPSIKFIDNTQSNIVKIGVHLNSVKYTTINDEIGRYFEIENLGTVPISPKCVDCDQNLDFDVTLREQREMDMIRKGLTYYPNKWKWGSTYPWVRDPLTLLNNFSGAFGQLKSLEKRLRKSPEDTRMYCEQIADMVNRKAIRKLAKAEVESYKGPVRYIPHHGVKKAISTSTPLRIVLNPTSTFMGQKLNDFWAKGANVLNSLTGVLLRFREELIAILGDVSKMYNSVLLETLEQHVHRILWRDMDTERQPDHYISLVVPFGDKPSGSIAITAMHETAKMYQKVCPEATRTILRDTYVDDIVKSVPSLTHATWLIQKIEEILEKGGFKVKHWIISGSESTDDTSLFNHITIDHTSEGNVLGMRWRPKDDVFIFKVADLYEETSAEHKLVLTRRLILSLMSRVYDPLGLLLPFLLNAKLLMREVCVAQGPTDGKGPCWDEPISTETCRKCQLFLVSLGKVKNIQFNRSIKPSDAVGHPILIIFCDGSKHAYGACAYIRWEHKDGTFSSYLICAKNRLAPLRTITIPRIELSAAVVACRLRSTITKELNFTFSKVYHITDSRIVQAQIQRDSHKFGVFVANRIAEIQTSSNPSEWYWTESNNNIADLTTRPADISKLDTFWKHGPEYLKLQEEKWPIDQDIKHIAPLPDIKATVNVSVNDTVYGIDIDLSIITIERFSELAKLLRVTAALLRIAKNRKFKCAFNLMPNDIQMASTCWIKYVQHVFAKDWKLRFKRLGAGIQEDGVISVGHRIQNYLKENWDRDSLILLPTKSHFSELVVVAAHSINHDGIDTTMARVRKDYWIPHLRKIVKKVRKSCYRCRIQDKKLCEQQMGVLPIERLKPSPPFYYSGTDLFGPIWIKDTVKKRTKMKCFGVVFNCLTTRALYLDIACGYDTDSFLLVLRRFITLRGCPYQIRSDPGSQLISASKEWKNIFENLDQSKIEEFSTNHGLHWVINKSADAPWQNGCTERLIRSVKRCLMLTIGPNILTFSELQTVYFECANILNERPIGMKDSSHSYFCPNDLILGRASSTVPGGRFDTDLNPKRRFQFIQGLTQQFWKRWHTHYFDSLIIQQKWHADHRNLQIGDIVLVPDNKSMKREWKLAEVSKASPGSDGKVRDVVLRYKMLDDKMNYKGAGDIEINRPVQRLVVVVPIEEQ